MNRIEPICEEFSKGNFSAAFDYFADDIKWEQPGSKTISGKDAVIDSCKKMDTEMPESQLTNSNVVAEDGRMAIEGRCQYRDENNRPAEMRYADFYRFENSKITSITSYCINVRES